jgi:hypothetical protein
MRVSKCLLKSQLTWSQVKGKLTAFDRAALVDLLHHLYAAHKDNQAFLHARFGLGEDVLEPYKKTLARWLCRTRAYGSRCCVAMAGGVNPVARCRTWKFTTKTFAADPATIQKGI